jgi:hypothetical protein
MSVQPAHRASRRASGIGAAAISIDIECLEGGGSIGVVAGKLTGQQIIDANQLVYATKAKTRLSRTAPTGATGTHAFRGALLQIERVFGQFRTGFLGNPEVAIDTNHLERTLRPIPMGRENRLFRWTEPGAEHVGQIQSLITTCVLQDVDPYTYLVDVLQRIATHPAGRVAELTPGLWKENFAHDPMRSVIDD